MYYLSVALLVATLVISPEREIYTITGAAVDVDLTCRRYDSVVTYRLTATSSGTTRYTIPGLSAWSRVSLLTTREDQVKRDDDAITWRDRQPGDELWIIGAGRSGCPESVPVVHYDGRAWLPMVMH